MTILELFNIYSDGQAALSKIKKQIYFYLNQRLSLEPLWRKEIWRGSNYWIQDIKLKNGWITFILKCNGTNDGPEYKKIGIPLSHFSSGFDLYNFIEEQKRGREERQNRRNKLINQRKLEREKIKQIEKEEKDRTLYLQLKEKYENQK